MDEDLERTARIAADPDAAIPSRVAALARIVHAASVDRVPIPDEVADAIDDPALVDGAIAARQAPAVIAAVVLLGPRQDLASSRRRVVRRLIAAGATGIALGGLAIAIGDVVAGVQLFVRDYRESIEPRLGRGHDALIGAWLGIVAEQPDTAAVAILRALDAAGVGLDSLIAHAPDERRRARLDLLRRAT